MRFTAVNMPLVRTAMAAPRRVHEQFPLPGPKQAAALVCAAVARRPERLTTSLGQLAQEVEALAIASRLRGIRR